MNTLPMPPNHLPLEENSEDPHLGTRKALFGGLCAVASRLGVCLPASPFLPAEEKHVLVTVWAGSHCADT